MLLPIFNAARNHYQGEPLAPVELLMYFASLTLKY